MDIAKFLRTAFLTLRKIQTFLPNFLVRKFSVNGQFPQIFGRFTKKSVETIREKLLTRKLSRNNYILHGEYLRWLLLPMNKLQKSGIKKKDFSSLI